jgi:hypothetical protein
MEIDTPIKIGLYPPTKSNLIVFTMRNAESEIAPKTQCVENQF